MDTSEGAIFINVYQDQYSGEPWGTVYLSDSSGSRFVNISIHSHYRYSRSLNYNRRKDTSCDFHKIKSMEGVYIANVVGNLHSPDCAKCRGSECRDKCQFVSKITIDKGAIWSNIIPPEVDSEGKKLCENKTPDVIINFSIY